MKLKKWMTIVCIVFLLSILGGCVSQTPEPSLTTADGISLSNRESDHKNPIPYTSLGQDIKGIEVFAFTDADGEYQYRAWAKNDLGETGFTKVQMIVTKEGISVFPIEGAGFLHPDKEPLGQIEPMEFPKNGTLPNGYQKMDGVVGAYYFYSSEGQKEYRSYGKFPGGLEYFWHANTQGQMIPGALSANIDADIAAATK